MSKRLIATLAGLLAIGVLLAGCGGGGDSTSADSSGTSAGSSETSAGGPALNKSEFVAQGNAICAKANEKASESIASFLAKGTIDDPENLSEEEEEELVSEAILPQAKAEAEALGALGAPKGEEKTVEEIVEGVEEVVADGEEDPGSVIGGEDPFEDVNAKAKAFGLDVCAES